jgi:hypothetical protein
MSFRTLCPVCKEGEISTHDTCDNCGVTLVADAPEPSND